MCSAVGRVIMTVELGYRHVHPVSRFALKESQLDDWKLWIHQLQDDPNNDSWAECRKKRSLRLRLVYNVAALR
jgi:hypothetical protein